MRSVKRTAIPALLASGVLWGATVPLSKVALDWLDPAWLTFGRFLIAALVLGFVSRGRLRAACSWPTVLWGASAFGLGVTFQNVGIADTSVSHASVLMGIVPVLVAITSFLAGHGHATRREWASYVLSAIGIGLIAAGGGGGASVGGDLLVVLSVVLSAGMIAAQPGLLRGRDPAAVTAVQFAAATAAALPLTLIDGRLPAAPPSAGPVLAFAALVLAGTVLPFWLFAHGQASVRPQLAGAFVNLEPVVGAAIGWVCFADPFGSRAAFGVLAVVVAIALVGLEGSPRLAGLRRRWHRAVLVETRLLDLRVPVSTRPSEAGATVLAEVSQLTLATPERQPVHC